MRVFSLLRKIYNAFLNFLFPASCYACGTSLEESDVYLCVNCEIFIKPVAGKLCKRCGSPLPLEGDCLDCKGREFLFERARILIHFNDTMQHLIHHVKYQHKRKLARDLGRRLGKQLCKDNDYFRPDVLVPVPLHPKRQRKRGFNQSEQIAQGLSVEIGVPVHTKLVKRVRNTKTQTGFNASERQRNVKNIFSCTSKVVPANVGVVDDVLTTGATVNECAQALLTAGAQRVQVFTLARA